MAFRNYLEGEDDKPYFHLNSLAHYYEEMQRYAALIKEMTGYIKDYGNELGLTKEEIDQKVTAFILENKTQLDQRLGEWDEKLQQFDGSVTDLLTEWVNDGTLNHIIDTTLIEQKIAPLAGLLAETATKKDLANMGSASPKGTYATLDLLQTSFPSGTTGIYIVVADGKWYYWDGTAWTPGGIYQSTGITDNSLSAKKINMTDVEVVGIDLSIGKRIPDKYVNYDGLEQTYTNTTTGGTTDFIPVTPGQKIEYVSYTNNYLFTGAYYDANKVRKSGIPAPTVNNGKVQTVIPVNVGFIRVNYGYSMVNQFYVSEITKEYYTPEWLKVKTTNLTDEVLSLITANPSGEVSKYQGKKIGIIGDSITYGFGLANRTLESYVTLVGNELGFSRITNYGASGSLMAKEGTSDSFVYRYSFMYNDEDVIVVFGGINDYFYGTKFGTKDSVDETEFYGALNVMMKGLLTKYPEKEILFMTPMNSYFNNQSTDQPNPNTGKTLKDYRDAVLERSEYYSIPCLDLFKVSGMDVAHNTAQRTAYSLDGVHPNATGNRRIADRLKGFLKVL